jgi:hypothetical protein
MKILMGRLNPRMLAALGNPNNVYQPSPDGWNILAVKRMDPEVSAMPGLRMLIMPFNLATAVAVTIALTYCCYVVLLFVWRALDTGFLQTGITCDMTSPENTGADWLGFRFSASFAGLRPLVVVSGSFLSVGPTYQTKSAPQGARARSR